MYHVWSVINTNTFGFTLLKIFYVTKIHWYANIIVGKSNSPKCLHCMVYYTGLTYIVYIPVPYAMTVFPMITCIGNSAMLLCPTDISL